MAKLGLNELEDDKYYYEEVVDSNLYRLDIQLNGSTIDLDATFGDVEYYSAEDDDHQYYAVAYSDAKTISFEGAVDGESAALIFNQISTIIENYDFNTDSGDIVEFFDDYDEALSYMNSQYPSINGSDVVEEMKYEIIKEICADELDYEEELEKAGW